jgi:hypothetical protein
MAGGLTTLIGAGLPTTTLFLGSIIFLMLLAVQFCIKISKLTDQVKNLSQENAINEPLAAKNIMEKVHDNQAFTYFDFPDGCFAFGSVCGWYEWHG